MILTNYKIVYLVTSLFGTYTIYRLIRLFYEERRTNRWIELASYLIYTAVVAVIYFTIGIPLVLMITSFVAFISLSFNYEGRFLKRNLLKKF